MKKLAIAPLLAACLMLFFSCQTTTEKDNKEEASLVAATAAPDAAQVRAEIEAIETRWAAAMNAKDINALMDLYAEDAISLPDGKPALVGKTAIRKAQEAEFAQPAKYASVAFTTTDVYPQGNFVTEVGKSEFTDAAGKVVMGGKYIAIFEKQNGKYVCVREIYNADAKTD